MNSVQITGRITTDGELKTTESGISVCSFTLAVKRPHTKDTTDFVNCTAWRHNAEFLTKYSRKGDLIGVVGSLQSREYTDKDGNKRKTWEVQCGEVEILSSKAERTEKATEQSKGETESAEEKPLFEDMSGDENLPF